MSSIRSLVDRTVERQSNAHVLLGAVVLVGFLLRAFALGSESLWVDEMHTVRTVVDETLAYIVLVLPILDPHPPLYYVVVDLWTRIPGVSAVSVRSVSVVCGVAAIPLMYAVAERIYDRRVGLFAALLFAFSPFYVWYGREARMYSLLTLLALVSMYTMLEWLAGTDDRWRGRTGYGLATVAIIYTHAFGALLVLAQNVYVIAFLDPYEVEGKWYEDWVRTQGLVGLASVPWIFNLVGGMFEAGRFRNNVSWIPDVTPLTLWKILGSYVGRTHPPSTPTSRRSLWVFDGLPDLSLLGEAVTLVALVLLLVPLVRYLRARNAADGDPDGSDAELGGEPDSPGEAERSGESGGDRAVDDGGEPATNGGAPGETAAESDGPPLDQDGSVRGIKPGLFLGCWLLVPVGALYAASVLVTPLLFDRFTAIAGVAALILVAREIDRLIDTDRQAMAAVGVVVLVLAVPLANVYAQPQKQQWEEAATIVETNADPGDAVVVTPFWANDSYHYYSDRDDLAYEAMPAGGARWEVAAATADRRTVWLVVAHHNETQSDRLMRSMDDLNFRRDRHESLTELDVYRFERTDNITG